MMVASPCQASRGHSTILTVLMPKPPLSWSWIASQIVRSIESGRQPVDVKHELLTTRPHDQFNRKSHCQLQFLTVDYVCSTPVFSSAISGFRDAASRAQLRASRVSAGSIM